MKSINVFKNNITIGGYSLPADFKCIDGEFLSLISDLDFNTRITKTYEYLTGNKLDKNAFENLKNTQFPSSIVCLDDNIAVVELFDGENAVYTDYIVSSKDLFGEISSIISLLTSIYLDLLNLGLIEENCKVNFTCCDIDNVFTLALIIAKKIGLPILNNLVASNANLKNNNYAKFYNYLDSELNDYILDFFLDFDYPLCSYSAPQIVAQNEYFENENDEVFTVIFAFLSPYIDARRCYKAITNKNEISIDKAINKLYNETAMEIPSGILNGKIQPFYKKRQTISSVDFKTILENIVK